MIFHVLLDFILLLRCEVAEVNCDLSLFFAFQSAVPEYAAEVGLLIIATVIIIIVIFVLSLDGDGHVAITQAKLLLYSGLDALLHYFKLFYAVTRDLELH